MGRITFERGTKRVKINSGLSEFPLDLLNVSSTLEFLDLSGNKSISTLPSDFRRFHKLKVLFLSDCSFTIFPPQLAECKSLEMIAFKNNGMTTIPEHAVPHHVRWLILTNNAIDSLPSSIGKCHRLQKCMLAGNNLRAIPDTMRKCKKLGLLRLSANKIEYLPKWLFEKMPELSFLAFAGNPCLEGPAGKNPVLDEVHWNELQLKEELGAGASGIISRGIWTEVDVGELKHVAVKIFKGDVTSDGSPHDEMKACLEVGKHPHVISTIGEVHSHPETKKGLVLELIPPNFTTLGGPPSLDSCTRDTFQPDQKYNIQKIKKILISIASAAVHLHEKGISHGDMYAHNILIDEAGHALLGDFGAATVYGVKNPFAAAIERLEVHAYGLLVEDMLSLLSDKNLSEKDLIAEVGLKDLHFECTNPVVKDRPAFREILKQLLAI